MRNKIEAEDSVDARKTTMGAKEALELAKSVSEIFACKGSKVVHIDIKKENPTESRLLEAMLGPTGNLRAPTIRVGDRLLVGFSEEVYTRTFKPSVASR